MKKNSFTGGAPRFRAGGDAVTGLSSGSMRGLKAYALPARLVSVAMAQVGNFWVVYERQAWTYLELVNGGGIRTAVTVCATREDAARGLHNLVRAYELSGNQALDPNRPEWAEVSPADVVRLSEEAREEFKAMRNAQRAVAGGVFRGANAQPVFG